MIFQQAGILILQGLSGAVFGILLFYLLGSLLTRRWIRIDLYQLLLSMAVAFLIAIVCEVYLGKLYQLVTGKPLWQYRVWPIHDGYTSVLNFIVWPVYGYYCYVLHHILHARQISIRPAWLKGLVSGFDGPLLEILANGFFLLFYGTFYFYYLPDDMRHFTSIQVVPLYMVMGVILTLVLDYLRERPRRWHYPAGFYLAGVGFVLAG
jgi:MFS family permease